MSGTRISLCNSQFEFVERLVVEVGTIRVYAFRYSGGVCALRIVNERGSIVVLPYQGQQIWRCEFDGVPLTMRSMFDEPVPTNDYLATYGGFLLHCGITGMGVPGESDDHPLHGELPNAPYRQAYLETGEDANGTFVAVGGCYHHVLAFNCNYRAEPRVVLHERSSLIDVSMKVTNLRAADMELMYMMHVNFRPVDDGRLIYSARPDPEHVRAFVSIPTHMKGGSGIARLKQFLNELAVSPSAHHVLDPDLPFDPEVVLSITCESDEDGWAHSMMVHPGGVASYIAHRPEELPVGIRWIARTADEDALGLLLPATAEHKGYAAEKEKGNIRILPAGESVEFHATAGLLKKHEADSMAEKIEGMLED